MPEPFVFMEGVSRRFGSGAGATDAVRDAWCVVSGKDRIALTGPSGSGKSTLLHLLGGLDTPTAGSISWPALGPRDLLRPALVADIFQGPSLLPPLTVLENARFPLVLQGMPDRRATEEAERALDLFGVLHLRDKLPEEISGGQAQRVSIARSVAVKPALILADEPTGQLDSATAAEILDRLLAAVDEIGAAIVISTHDPQVAARLAQIWTMRDGQVDTGGARTAAAGNGRVAHPIHASSQGIGVVNE